MKKHIGNLEITKKNENDFLDITEVTGYVSVYDSAKLDAPLLTTVGGDVYVSGSAKLDAPNLKNKNDNSAKEIATHALTLAFSRSGLIKIDGILSWLLGEKTIGKVTVFELKIVGKLKTSYAVKRGDKYAHGETVEKAIEDLRYKISSRDVSAFKSWVKNEPVTLDEAIEGYRVITGACEQGVRGFVESLRNLPEKITPKEIIKLTDGKFGNDVLSKFLEEQVKP